MKMKRKTIESMAMFMIMLIIGIPFYISDARASSLEVTKISGADGVDGFVRPTDVLTIEAEASISESEDVDTQKMRIYVGDSELYSLFFECNPSQDANFICSYYETLFGVSGTNTYRIDLHTGATQDIDDADPIESVTKTVTVDVEEALVEEINATPERSGDRSTTISFRAKDFGISPADDENCSGVGRVEFYKDDYDGDLILIDYPAEPLCNYESSFEYSADSAEDGAYTICAQAFDRLNQSLVQSKCTTFYVDSGEPKPSQNSLRIVKAGTEEPIEYAGKNSVMADISYSINAEDLVPESVSTDFSSVAESRFADRDYTSYDFQDGTHTFTWENFPLGPISSCVIDVYAEDTVGNSGTTSVPCGIKTDDKGPVVKGLFTNFEKDGIYYFGKNTNLTAKIEEEGIGLSRGLVKADFTNIGAGSNRFADECMHLQGKEWECQWYNIEATASDDDNYPVSIYKESRDDLDNIMTAKYEQVMGVDKSSPEINQEVEMTVLAGITDVPYEDVTLSGDTLEFVIAVSDAWSAAANFSSIGLGDDVLPVTCWRENQTTYCKWEAMIEASGPYDAELSFSFTDFAGNQNSIKRTITVSGREDEEEPNYWQNTVTCTPSFMDREVASLMEQTAYCNIALSPINNQAAKIISFNMETYPSACSFVEYSGGAASEEATPAVTDFIQNIAVMNNYEGSESPYVQITLQSGEFNFDEFAFKCNFEIFTEVDGTYTTYPETEEAEFRLGFYEMPMGSIEDKYEDEIETVEKRLEWLEGWLDEVMVAYEWAKKGCDLYQALNTVIASLSVIAAVFGYAAAATDKWPGYGQAWEGLWRGSCNSDSGAKSSILALKSGFFDKLCSFVNCKWSQEALDAASAGMTEKLSGGALGADADIQQAIDNGFDVKKSIIWSIGTLCVPGILLNLQKWEQLECQYILCLKRDVPAGMPYSGCRAIRSYMMCSFVMGEILNALPFMQIWEQVLKNFQQIISNPLSAITWLVEQLVDCDALCKASTDAVTKAEGATCVALTALDLLGDAVEEVVAMKEDDYFQLPGMTEAGDDPNDYCGQYEAYLEESEDDE